MAVCCNGIQAGVCSQTASGSELPIYNSHTWIATHTFRSSHWRGFFLVVFLPLCPFHVCVHIHVFVCLRLSPRKPIRRSKSMNCSVFVLVNKPKMSIDHQEEDRLISSRGKGGGIDNH